MVFPHERFDLSDFLWREIDHVLDGNGDRSAIAAQDAWPHRAIKVAKVIGPDLRQKKMVEIASDISRQGFTLEYAPHCLVVLPALDRNRPDLIYIRVICEQPGALARDCPDDMGVWMILPQLPCKNGRVEAVAVGS